MKKIPFLLMLLSSFESMAQSHVWFFSISSSYVIHGPGQAIRNKMEDQHFNSNSVGWLSNPNYPIKGRKINFLGRGGVRISNKTMAYALAGAADRGRVKGYRATSDYSQTNNETHPRFDYNLYQLAAGFMYTPNRLKLGLAPSLFKLDYSFAEEKRKSSLSPGLNITFQVPLTKTGSFAGLELVIDVNYSSKMTLSRSSPYTEIFEPGNIRIVNGSIGLAFTFSHVEIQ